MECLRRPEIRGKPVVVVGAKEERHGVVLAKNMIAKRGRQNGRRILGSAPKVRKRPRRSTGGLFGILKSIEKGA